jgi:hypothetical protein
MRSDRVLEQNAGAVESDARVEAGPVEAHQREQGMNRLI